MKRILIYLVIVFIAVIGILVAFGDDLDLSAAPGNNALVIAHRGGRGLWPENTLYAFRQAVELGVDVLEMDVRSTSDGVLVVIHDETVNRATNGKGSVDEFTFSALKSLDAGHSWTQDGGRSYPFRGQGISVPALSEVFTAFPGVRLNIEIKQVSPEIVKPLCNLIRLHKNAENLTIASFDGDTLKGFRKSCPEVATSATAVEVGISYVLSLLHIGSFYTPSAKALQIPEYLSKRHVASARFVRTAQKNGLQVHVWTINNPDRMKRLLSIGVDGIMTDYPDRLLALLHR